MQGGHSTSIPCGGEARNTPAYAGSTTSGCRPPPLYKRNHPRTCGEYADASTVSHTATGGSPPHMRGAQKRDASRVNTHRITPTYAGRTVTIGAVTASVSNHHHVCEEHIKYVYKSPSRLGTSPRMRRSPQNRTDDMRCSRIIPTYAGSTP